MGTSKLSEALSPKDPALSKLIIRALDPSANHNRPLPNSSRGSRIIEVSRVLFLLLGYLPGYRAHLFPFSRWTLTVYFGLIIDSIFWNCHGTLPRFMQATGDFLELNDLHYKYFLE